MRRLLFLFTLAGSLFVPCALARDVPFVPTPEKVVDRMLEIAKVGPNDMVYDLGSGDGRIVIAAAERYGCTGVGVEIDPELVERSEQAARQAGVDDKVSFLRGDFFVADIRPATVVMLYLTPRVNRRLAPRLLAQLAPGTRVVSHKYAIEGWKPERRIKVEGRPLFLYVIP